MNTGINHLSIAYQLVRSELCFIVPLVSNSSKRDESPFDRPPFSPDEPFGDPFGFLEGLLRSQKLRALAMREDVQVIAASANGEGVRKRSGPVERGVEKSVTQGTGVVLFF